MNIIAWILLGIVGLNLVAFGIMWIVFIKEGRRRRREQRGNGQIGRAHV